MKLACPICARGTLHTATVAEEITYGDKTLLVEGIEISRCDACENEIVLPDQLKANELRFADAKRTSDSLLRSDEIVSWRKQYNLTQVDAAALLGGGANAFSKYERGEVIQTRAMDLLIRSTMISPQTRRFLSQRAGIPFATDEWEDIDGGGVTDFAGFKVRSLIPQAPIEVKDLGWTADDVECGSRGN